MTNKQSGLQFLSAGLVAATIFTHARQQKPRCMTATRIEQGRTRETGEGGGRGEERRGKKRRGDAMPAGEGRAGTRRTTEHTPRSGVAAPVVSVVEAKRCYGAGNHTNERRTQAPHRPRTDSGQRGGKTAGDTTTKETIMLKNLCYHSVSGLPTC